MWFHHPASFYPLESLPAAEDYDLVDPEQLTHKHRGKSVLFAVLLGAFIALIAFIAFGDRLPGGIACCSPTPSPYRHWVVLVDRSDRLRDNQLHALESNLTELHRELRIGDRLSLYVMTPGDANGLVKLLFDQRRPKRGSDADPLTENPKHKEKTYQETYVLPYEKALRELAVHRPSDTSPIIEAIYELGKSGPLCDRVEHRVLHLWSDMLQNSPLLSQFKSGYGIEGLKTSAYLDVPSLRGVEVTLYQIRNQHEKKQSRPEHEAFWRDYFLRLGIPAPGLTRRQL
jgi:hypothetical protein